MQSPLVAKAWERRPRTAPTSDQIPASAPADDFMHAHKWKRGVRENVATVKEIRRKASKIATAYNKGARFEITLPTNIPVALTGERL